VSHTTVPILDRLGLGAFKIYRLPCGHRGFIRSIVKHGERPPTITVACEDCTECTVLLEELQGCCG
jgi:hypothetical protein